MSAVRSFWPREHGAYAQLLVPLAMALALHAPTWSAVLLALAAICAFLANEPLLVVLGHRGKRARVEAGARAMRWLAIATTVAILAGTAGLVLGGAATRAVAAGVAVPAMLLIVLASRRAERTLVGELVAAIALPGASAVVATASGMPTRAALMMALAWSLGFACTVLAVHRVIARNRRSVTWVDGVVAITLLGAIALSWCVARAVFPLALVSCVLVVCPPPARRLRVIGVALATTSIGCGLLMLAM